MEKLNAGLLAIQGVATGVVVVFAIIAAAIVFCKNIGSIDEQGVKHKMLSSFLTILAMVAIMAALIWGVPWIWSLFVG